MGVAGSVEPTDRAVSIAAVVAIHALLVVVALASTMSSANPKPKMAGLSVYSLEAQAAAPTIPPPPRMPSKVVAHTPPIQSLIFDVGTDAQAKRAGAGCATMEIVAKTLAADPAALDSVLNAPSEARSIADAVVIWNAGWSPFASSHLAPLGAARANVEQSLATLDDQCLDEPLAGPRFLPFPGGKGTVFLVFGSGQWTWRQLTEEIAPIESPTNQPDLDDELRRIFDSWFGN